MFSLGDETMVHISPTRLSRAVASLQLSGTLGDSPPLSVSKSKNQELPINTQKNAHSKTTLGRLDRTEVLGWADSPVGSDQGVRHHSILGWNNVAAAVERPVPAGRANNGQVGERGGLKLWGGGLRGGGFTCAAMARTSSGTMHIRNTLHPSCLSCLHRNGLFSSRICT